MNRYGGFPGHLSGGVGGGIGEGICAYFVLFRGVKERAVLTNGDGATPGLACDGEGQRLSLGIGNLQSAFVGHIFIGFNSGVHCDGGLVLLALDGDGYCGGGFHPVGVNGQIGDLRFGVGLGQQGNKGHLADLVSGEDIPGLQYPMPQQNGAKITVR